jgi:hypothetical protein
VISESVTLEDVTKEKIATYRQFVAEPVDEADLTSPWLTGRPRALKAVKQVLGTSDYQAHAGAYTGGANAVYWLEIVGERPDGLVVVSNITEGAKRNVENVQAALEPDLLYPLLRGRDVHRWQATPSAYLLMVQDPEKRRGYAEDYLSVKYPRIFTYLKRFEPALRLRAAFKRYFRDTDPFYSMFDIGDYTFAPYKAVWLGFGARKMQAAVVSTADGKPIMTNQAMHPFVPTQGEIEAHYLAACLNSTPFEFGVVSHTQVGGKSFAQSNILQTLRIPKYDADNHIHLRLAALSQEAHKATAVEDTARVREVEAEIDQQAASLWELTSAELQDIQTSLEELQ